jgi:hypothetical protein
MIEELGCLKELRGALKICKLEQVRDREEAEKAKLRDKRMNKLVFEWSDDEGNSGVNNEDVLEGLQPHPDIRSLTIKGYRGESISICGLSSLVEFEIDSCDELRYLSGEFHGFTSLRVLRISSCSKLASIPGIQHCTALVELDIRYCHELTSIPGDFRELKYSLKELIVNGCKLGALPSGLQCCASLERLVIIDWSELIHISDLQELSSLRSLTISSCDKLISIDWHGLRQLPSLGHLTIIGCRSLSVSQRMIA